LNELSIETARVFERLLKPSRYKGAWGGRGSGNSHFMVGAVDLLEHDRLVPRETAPAARAAVGAT